MKKMLFILLLSFPFFAGFACNTQFVGQDNAVQPEIEQEDTQQPLDNIPVSGDPVVPAVVPTEETVQTELNETMEPHSEPLPPDVFGQAEEETAQFQTEMKLQEKKGNQKATLIGMGIGAILTTYALGAIGYHWYKHEKERLKKNNPEVRRLRERIVELRILENNLETELRQVRRNQNGGQNQPNQGGQVRQLIAERNANLAEINRLRGQLAQVQQQIAQPQPQVGGVDPNPVVVDPNPVVQPPVVGGEHDHDGEGDDDDDDDHDHQCPVCMASFTDEQIHAGTLTCGHFICQACSEYGGGVAFNNGCPICRGEVHGGHSGR